MTATTIAGLKAQMPIGTTGGISATDMHDLIDTMEAIAGGVSVRSHGAVGNGTADDTAAINAALATGKDVVLPSGTYRITNKLTMSTAKQRFIGTGGIIQIRTSTMATTHALEVRAADCTVQGIRFENPDLLFDRITPFGNASCVRIFASRARIIDNTIVSWIDGICVDPYTGEHVGHIIAGNFLLEMLGAGLGGSDVVDVNGEDRGDGIVTWGAGATIVNNYVALKAGQDGRIGIHTEALPEASPDQTPVYKDRGITIAGNVVFGHYRRGIVTEKVTDVTISGNVVAAGSWWSICAIMTNNVVISGNTIIFDRISTDNSGGSYSPDRAAIATWGANDTITVTGNVINLVGVGRGFTTSGVDAATRAKNYSITGNVIKGAAGSTHGIYMNHTDGCVVSGNIITGTGANGIICNASTDITVTSNRVSGVASGAGIRLEDLGVQVKTGIVSNNSVTSSGSNPGIIAINLAGLNITGNTVGTTTGAAIDIFGCTNTICSYNIFRNATTGVANGTGTGNIVGNNISFTAA